MAILPPPINPIFFSSIAVSLRKFENLNALAYFSQD